MTEPKSMDECVYFTNRVFESGGKARAWVYKVNCPECGKAKMGKPVVKGKIKSRATEYVCPACSFKEEKSEHEKRLTVEVIYTCSGCKNSGETTTPYKRKTFEGAQAFVFSCQKCGKQMGLTKKLK
jgi:predicted RNA-binding Zn-ribbon protein involved in translation (DUF1610 family)